MVDEALMQREVQDLRERNEREWALLAQDLSLTATETKLASALAKEVMFDTLQVATYLTRDGQAKAKAISEMAMRYAIDSMRNSRVLCETMGKEAAIKAMLATTATGVTPPPPSGIAGEE